MSDILDLIDNTIEHVESWPDAMRWQPAPRGWAKSGADELYWAMWRRKCRSVMQTRAHVVFHDSHVVVFDEVHQWLNDCADVLPSFRQRLAALAERANEFGAALQTWSNREAP